MIWRNFVTMLAMSGVFIIALVFVQSDEPSDRGLAWTVISVYIFIGAYHVYRLTRRTKRTK